MDFRRAPAFDFRATVAARVHALGPRFHASRPLAIALPRRRLAHSPGPRPSPPPHSRARQKTLKDRLFELVPGKQKELKEFMTKYGEKELGKVTVSQAVGGARDVKCMFWETSLLDAQEVRPPSRRSGAWIVCAAPH